MSATFLDATKDDKMNAAAEALAEAGKRKANDDASGDNSKRAAEEDSGSEDDEVPINHPKPKSSRHRILWLVALKIMTLTILLTRGATSCACVQEDEDVVQGDVYIKFCQDVDRNKRVQLTRGQILQAWALWAVGNNADPMPKYGSTMTSHTRGILG